MFSYGTSGDDSKRRGYLYRIDTQTGALTPIGRTGFTGVEALSFRPTDASLWGWAVGTGLVQINPATGTGTIVYRSPLGVEGLAWNNEGTILYTAAGTTLRAYNPVNRTLKKIASNLPGPTEALEMLPSGLLLGGTHESTSANLFTYNVATRQVVERIRLNSPFNDIEGLAVPTSCGTITAADDTYRTDEDQALTVAAPGVLANDHAPSGDPLTATLISGPSHGTLALHPDGSFVYTPSADFNGDDSFTYSATDGHATSPTATVRITVSPVDDAPVATDDTYSVDEDSELTIPTPGVLANDRDLENDTLSAALASGPSHGALVLHPDGSFTYTPNPNFNGVDSFTYRASDGALTSNVGTVTITVRAVPGAPLASDDAYSVDENRTLEIPTLGVLANDSDPAGRTITARLATGPLSGTLTLNPDGSFSYVPKANFSGADSFTYRANNGPHDSNLATVRLTVTHVNGPPAIVSAAPTHTVVDAPYRYDVDASDPDPGDTLTFALETGPTGMTIDARTGQIQWTPGTADLDQHPVTVRVADAAGLADRQRYTLDVTKGPPAALANDDSYSVDEDHVLALPGPGVLANDLAPVDATLTARLASGPVHGTLILTPDGAFSYTPGATGFVGVDHFTYRADDGVHAPSTATVTITVNPLPVTVPDVIGMALPAATRTITEARLITGTVTTVDGAIRLDMNSLPSAQGWTYRTEDSRVAETDVFSVSNGLLHQNTLGKGGLTVRYVLPDVVDSHLPFTVSVRARVLAHEGDVLNPWSFDLIVMTGAESFEVGISPTVIRSTRGTFFSTTIDNTQFHNYRMEGIPGVGMRFFVDDVLVGSDTPYPLIYPNQLWLSDSTQGSNARVDIASYSFTQPRVTAQNPVGGTRILKGSPVDLVVTTGPAKVTVPNVVGMAQAAAETTIVAAKLAVGAVSTQYSSSLPVGQVIGQTPLAGTTVTAGASVAIVVSLGAAPNQAPVALNDNYSPDEDSTLTVPAPGVLANDSDPNGDVITATLVSDPAYGSVNLHADGSFSYTPNTDFNSTDPRANTVLATVPVGAGDQWSEANPVTNHVYIANSASNTISVLDGAANTVLATIPVGRAPEDVGVNPRTNRAYVSNRGSNTVSVIDGATNTVIATIPVEREPTDVRVNPDTNRIYVNNDSDNSVSVIDGAADAIIATLPVGNHPGESAIDRTTNRIYIVNSFSNNVSVIDGATNQIIATIPVGNAPEDISLNPETNRIYVSNRSSRTISVIDGATNSVIATIPALGDPGDGNDLNPRTNRLYVKNVGGPNTVGVIDGTTNTLIATIPIGNVPGWVRVNPTTNCVYVTTSDGNSISVIDGGANALIANVPVGSRPIRIGVNPVANRVYINTDGNSVSVINAGFRCSDSFSYQASDGSLDSNVATAVISVNGVNDAPVAASDGYTVTANTAITVPAAGVLGNDRDVDGDPLAAVLVSGPIHGMLVLTPDGSFDYTPNAGFSGADSFTYTANDGTLDSGVATVRITVTTAQTCDPTAAPAAWPSSGPGPGAWTPTGSLNATRSAHTATLLPNGKVLVVGSSDPAAIATTELYDPATGRWSFAAPLLTPRFFHTATLLASGKVLVVGGLNPTDLSSAELYDPATNTWSPAASLHVARYEHTATLLADGSVLVTGGYSSDVGTLQSTERYDPATDSWSPVNDMGTPRYDHRAILLANGKVLITGGQSLNSSGYASAELFDPATNTWAPAAPMHAPRVRHTATLLSDGQVLVAGGESTGTAELYDPVANTWTMTGQMLTPRSWHAAVLFGDRVVVIGGENNGGRLSTAEVFDPVTNRWSNFPSLALARSEDTAVVLSDGMFLVAGGFTASAELYHPGVAGWTPTTDMPEPRDGATMTLLCDGSVLVVGGSGNGTAVRYDPSTERWSSAYSMRVPRSRAHTSTLLRNGKVLVVGGNGPDPTSAELYDPMTNSWSDAGHTHEPRGAHRAVLLNDGSVLVIGGGLPNNLDLASVERYDPTTNSWTVVAPMNVPREWHTATLLRDGTVLVAGGFANFSTATPSAELYDPATNTWSLVGSLTTERAKFHAILLHDGRVLVVGGYGTGGGPVLSSAEIYNPDSKTWSTAAPMHEPRYSFVATILGDGSVLVAGGSDSPNLASTELYNPYTNQWAYSGAMPRGWGAGEPARPAVLYDGRVLLVGGSSTASAEIYDPRGASITPQPPLAVDDSYLTNVGVALTVPAPGVLTNDGDPNGDQITATRVSGPAHGTLILNPDGAFNYTPNAGFHGVDHFTYTASDGTLTSNVATVSIDLNDPPVITSTPAVSATADQRYQYAVTATDADVDDTVRFVLTTAPIGMAIEPLTGLITWTPSSVQVGQQQVEVQATDDRGGTATQHYTITVAAANPINTPPVITSTPIVTATEGAVYQYQVTATDAEHDPLRFSLTITPTGMTINPATGAISWTPSDTQAGSYVVMVRVDDGHGGVALQRYTLTVAEAVDTPPIITSNPETASIEGLQYRYDVDATDADGDSLTFRLITAPVGMTIDATTGVIDWIASGAQAGIYGIIVEVNDGRGGTDTQSFAILVGEAINNSPLITSIPGNTAVVGALYQYQVVATDADHDLLAYSLATAPTGMTIRAETGLIEWTPTSAQLGDQPVAVRVDDGRGLFTTQSFVVRVASVADTTSPVVKVTIDPPDITVGQTVRFTVTASDNVGVTSLTLKLNGVDLPLDAHGQATFTPPAAGTYTAAARAQDAAGNSRTAVAIFDVHDPADTTLPTAHLTSPDDDTIVEMVTSVVGTASDDHLARYELSLAPMDTDTFTVVASGTQPVIDGVLGHIDPTLLQNGMYRLRLTVVDIGGNTATDERVVQVQGQAKVGIFTLSFTDLEVPVAGLPIQVVRTYDSRDKRVGDFGVGWTLDLKTVRLQTNRVLGGDWQGTRTGSVFDRLYCIQQTRTHIVTVTLPDGTVEKFKPTLTPQCQRLAPILQVTLGFQPMPGTNAALAPVGNALLFPDGTNPGEFNLVTDIADPTPYDPSQYVLTLHDGRRLLIDRQAGLQQITDLNGNTLTITPTEIKHSSGKSVTFARDGQNRITSITDPRGKTIAYAYDANGDLIHVTDQQTQTTTFTYNQNHDLLTITDPRGVQPIRNEYDSSGRLIAHTDANGNRVVYTHAIGAGEESVQDRLGQVTFYSYNERGDVVSQTDALGNTTSYTYDTRGNQLSETDALGHVTRSTYDEQDNLLNQTDALGHTSSYTYNDRGQLLTTADPLGRMTTNTYDASGNLTETRDPLGNATTYTYTRGLQTAMTDPLNNVTHYEYDGAGNLKKETDALHHVTAYAYDANGNRLNQVTTRTTLTGTETLMTTYDYDGLNRLIKTIYPDKSTTETRYNSIGQQEMTIDQLGRQTHYAYDDQGRLVATTYPDSAREESAYDAEGRRISSTDRAGRTTTFSYDALGRLVTTTAPDGAATTTVYNAIGQTIAATDALSNTTRYGYDPAGRQIAVTDALSHTTAFSYDEVGNQRTMTDPLGNTTTYEYDNNNRRTAVIFPDDTRQVTDYDDLGRSVAQTDQAGKTTQYGYDPLGRLTVVTDTLNLVTHYGYDELGNQISQTDALGRTTRFAYDTMGRRVSRALPLGRAESMGYDLAGQLTRKTDFNGKTTTYTYDIMGRLTRKTPDPLLGEPPVSFDYTPSGQRAHMIDASGVTNYTYDLRDRLSSKATPWGTLSYRYDANGSLLSIRSSNANGASANYAYDALNRLASVQDNNLTNGTTSYAYDPNGNLAGYEYPNQTRTSYAYDRLNRLTAMNIARPAITLASYTYTLGQAGNRTAVDEQGGRTLHYSYDDLYRLTSEQIAGDPNGKNGTVGYEYDAVGNRLRRTSTLPPVPATAATYNANDHLIGDGYDDNGNTVDSGGHRYAYDFENHLVSMDNGAVTYLYDGDGNRVAKTFGGITTRYLVDDRNPTGYAQVLEELVGGAVVRSYTYGSDLISQRQLIGGAWITSFYGYDGHGSVRFLTDATGAVTDRYDYDAFGILIGSTGATPNSYLYSGEQFDVNAGMTYLRARYMQPATGRFWTMDSFEGKANNPLSLHKYLYTHANSVNNIDPSGKQFLGIGELPVVVAINNILERYEAVQSFLSLKIAKARISAAVSVYKFTRAYLNPIITNEGIQFNFDLKAELGGEIRIFCRLNGQYGSKPIIYPKGHGECIDIELQFSREEGKTITQIGCSLSTGCAAKFSGQIFEKGPAKLFLDVKVAPPVEQIILRVQVKIPKIYEANWEIFRIPDDVENLRHSVYG